MSKRSGKELTGEQLAVLDRVRKLVALGESRNVHEAEVALSKANEILIKHKLSMGDLVDAEAMAKEAEANPLGTAHVVIEKNTIHRSKTPWVISLADTLARHHFCQAIFGKSYVLFIGRREDTEVATYLFIVLRRNLADLSAQARAQYVVDFKAKYGFKAGSLSGHHHPLSYQYSWLEGAVAGLGDALRRVRAQYEREAGMQALVIRSAGEIEAFVSEIFPRLKTRVRTKTVMNSDGWNAGVKVGGSLRLPTAVKAPAKKAERAGISAPK